MEFLDALELEIQFWKDLLNSQAVDSPSEVLERITLAKTLAEHKLTAITGLGTDAIN